MSDNTSIDNEIMRNLSDVHGALQHYFGLCKLALVVRQLIEKNLVEYLFWPEGLQNELKWDLHCNLCVHQLY